MLPPWSSINLNKIGTVLGLSVVAIGTIFTTALATVKLTRSSSPSVPDIPSVASASQQPPGRVEDDSAGVTAADRSIDAQTVSSVIPSSSIPEGLDRTSSNPETIEVAEGGDDDFFSEIASDEDEESNDTTDDIPQDQPTEILPNITNSGETFTLQELAQYDGRNGKCYIALSGKVYDVTQHPAWNNCTHHGVRGGRDITSVFPHAISVLTGIPVVGTLDSSASGQDPAVTPSNPPLTEQDEEDDQKEEESEDDD